MKYTRCSNCGRVITEGSRAYIGIHSGRGDVFCSKDCVVEYITTGESTYIDSQTDDQLNWFNTQNNRSAAEGK